jgi:hypothetical protein
MMARLLAENFERFNGMISPSGGAALFPKSSKVEV